MWLMKFNNGRAQPAAAGCQRQRDNRARCEPGSQGGINEMRRVADIFRYQRMARPQDRLGYAGCAFGRQHQGRNLRPRLRSSRRDRQAARFVPQSEKANISRQQVAQPGRERLQQRLKV